MAAGCSTGGSAAGVLTGRRAVGDTRSDIYSGGGKCQYWDRFA